MRNGAGMTHRPVYRDLCQRAEALGYDVELTVGKLNKHTTGNMTITWRNFERLRIVDDKKRVLADVAVRHDDIDTAADHALKEIVR